MSKFSNIETKTAFLFETFEFFKFENCFGFRTFGFRA